MTPKQIKNRVFFKKATSLPKRDSVKKFSRRESNTNLKIEEHPNDEFESFFEFEEELSELKSASSQYIESIENKDDFKDKISVMEKDENNLEVTQYSENNLNKTSANKIGILVEEKNVFDFTKCEYFDSDKKHCNNKKVKGSIYCKSHKELLVENIKNSNGL